LLKRRDPVPDGVTAQLGFGGGGAGGSCFPLQETKIVVRQQLQIADEAYLTSICLTGLVPKQDIQVQVALPDGSMRRNRLRADRAGTALWEWNLLPGEPLGEYTITASQAALRLDSNFTVSAASQPKMLIIPPEGPPGTTFQIGLAGFQPGTRAMIPLYRHHARYSTYLTQLPIEINARGEGLYTLRTRPDDDAGTYDLILDASKGRPYAQSNHTFTLYAGFEHASLAPVVLPESVLQRQNAAPANVSLLLYEADRPCAPRNAAMIEFDTWQFQKTRTIEIPSFNGHTLCVSGFEPGHTVTIAITQSDGVVQEQRIQASEAGTGELKWPFKPNQPLGLYTMTATDGTHRATQRFTVQIPAQPEIVAEPSIAAPGSDFQVLLGGFQPHQQFELKLYRRLPCKLDAVYLTTVSSIKMNEYGGAIYNLRSSKDDPPELYGFSVFRAYSSLEAQEELHGRFSVTDQQTMRVLPDTSSGGGTFNIALGGFSATLCGMYIAELQIFRRMDDGSYAFVGTLPVRSSEEGEADLATLHMRPEDPRGEYLVTVFHHGDEPSLRASLTW
jgi:hypothetical protein